VRFDRLRDLVHARLVGTVGIGTLCTLGLKLVEQFGFMDFIERLTAQWAYRLSSLNIRDPRFERLHFVIQRAVERAQRGGGEEQGFEEEAVNYAIENILIPENRDSDFVVEWMRKSTGVGDDSPEELGLRFWKWEGGALSVITLEEFQELAAQREVGDSRVWIYSQHSVMVMEADEAKGEAVVEIGSLYGPLTGSGVRYLLRKGEDGWEKVSEQTVWVA
jgi:hypothetical protein